MSFPRSSGILLHPTSLPGAYGIGELGREAHRFADFLRDAGQRIWQVLPLEPTDYGDSPYQCFSAFAGNPLLISLDTLVERGYLESRQLDSRPEFPAGEVDFGAVIAWKIPLLRHMLPGRSNAVRRPSAKNSPLSAKGTPPGSTNLPSSWPSRKRTTTLCGRGPRSGDA